MNNSDAEKVIDMAIIETLRELGGTEDPGLVSELIDLYLLDAPERIREIQDALARDDFDLLERASHTLKSASANIGASQLSEFCAELECMARSRSVTDPGAQSELSEATFQQVHQALSQLRD